MVTGAMVHVFRQPVLRVKQVKNATSATSVYVVLPLVPGSSDEDTGVGAVRPTRYVIY